MSSIRVTLVFDDHEVDREGGCYGCLGRMDSYLASTGSADAKLTDYMISLAGPEYEWWEDDAHDDGYDDVAEWRKEFIDPGPSWQSNSTLDEVHMYKKDAESYANGEIFHPENAEWFKFLKESSITQGIISTIDEYNDGVIRIDAKIPADRMIWILFLLRAPCDYRGCSYIYRCIKDEPLNDFGKVFFSLGLAGVVGRGDAPFSMSRGDGTLFNTIMVKDIAYHLEHCAPIECEECTFSEAQAYPMSVNSRWYRYPHKGKDISYLRREFEGAVPLERVRGFFIDRGTIRVFRDDDNVREVTRDAVRWIMDTNNH